VIDAPEPSRPEFVVLRRRLFCWCTRPFGVPRSVAARKPGSTVAVMTRAHLRRYVTVAVAALAASVALLVTTGPAAGAVRLRPQGEVSVTYATGALAATGAVVPVTVKISGAARTSTCGLAYNSSNPSPVFVSISPARAVNCRTGRAQFKVTLGSNLAPVASAVPLQFSFNVSTTLSEVHDLSLQVAAGTANATPVPPGGQDYLGAFVDPEGPGKPEPAQAEALDTSIGRPKGIGILHWSIAFGYSPAKTKASIAQLVKAPLNAVPLLDWSPAASCAAAPSKVSKCVSWLKGVASGDDDRTIKAMAVGLKAFGKPMLLRFFGEMNLHLLSTSGQYFVAAWDHILGLFSKEDVTNVSFVWAPALATTGKATAVGARGAGASGAAGTGLGSFFSFFPGASEVDWIGVDAYDHQSYGSAGFSDLFKPWYAEWGGQDRPMMISATAARTRGVKVGAQSCPAPARTGVPGDEQAAYIKSIAAALNPTSPATAQYPNIKALIYWDSAGSQGPYCFDKGGLKEFKSLAQEPFFSFMAPNQ
jgi:hypothetical protein